ncbi:STAS domain-containing protein [Umezawaea endophytica]|uniref:Anti-sigma factor antagonist n=1 Tax=Umezawaea endophytica TaxID=1654476 RepID=A0A9X3AH89_9PSEU|nr:STAS domain-containing protein [Umezawaea endophytica]MCS7480691.1 STAS domain-containing protein [Umezawaea endophytica]
MGTEQAAAADHETISGSQEVRDDVVLLTVKGEVDVATAPKLREWLDEAFAAKKSAVVLDLIGVEFFGSVGLAMLVEYHGRGELDEIELRTVAPARAVAGPIYLTTLDKVLKLYPDTAGALAAS